MASRDANLIYMTSYLTTAQAAEILGLSAGTLANWRSSDQGPRWIKLGARSVRYLRADLDAWAMSEMVSA